MRTAKKKITIKDEGMILVEDVDSLDFVGAGIDGSAIGNDVTETISPETQDLQSVTDMGAETTNKITVPAVQFDTSATPQPNAEGLMQWNATDGTLDLGMDGGDITMQLGQEMFTKVRNQSGATILNGKAVYFSGRLGNRPLISLALGDAEVTSRVAGITTQDITSPSDGFITTVGYVRGIKTDYTGAGVWGTTWVEGDLLYVSKTVAGQITNVEPAIPHHVDIIGSVGIVHSSLGSILINIERHRALEGLSDVNGTAPIDGSIPSYHAGGGYFDFDKNINDFTIQSFETYSKNLIGYDGNVEDISDTVTVVTYNTPSGDIIKTITEVSSTVTTITFSGIYSLGIVTKTLTEVGDITYFSYS